MWLLTSIPQLLCGKQSLHFSNKALSIYAAESQSEISKGF